RLERPEESRGDRDAISCASRLTPSPATASPRLPAGTARRTGRGCRSARQCTPPGPSPWLVLTSGCLALARGELHGLDDLRIGGAAAQVPREVMPDVVL